MLQISAFDPTQAQTFGPGERKTTQPAQTAVDTSVPLEWRALLFPPVSNWNCHQEMNLACINCLSLRGLCVSARPRAAAMKTERMARSEVDRSWMTGPLGRVYQLKQDSVFFRLSFLLQQLNLMDFSLISAVFEFVVSPNVGLCTQALMSR